MNNWNFFSIYNTHVDKMIWAFFMLDIRKYLKNGYSHQPLIYIYVIYAKSVT